MSKNISSFECESTFSTNTGLKRLTLNSHLQNQSLSIKTQTELEKKNTSIEFHPICFVNLLKKAII